MRLKIELFNNWAPYEMPDGPSTFCRQESSNAFQISWAEYCGESPLPEITTDSLKQMAIKFGNDNRFGDLIESSGDDCRFGRFGSAVFRSDEYPRTQVWFITDGRDYIMATHICDSEPEPSEVAEVQAIARSLALGPEAAA